MSNQLVVKNDQAISTQTGFSKESILKYELEVIQVNNYLASISRPADREKALNALNKNPTYAHQKIAEYSNLGLSIANRDYYIIPYGERAEFPIDYKGLLKVAAMEARENGFQLIVKADTIKEKSAGSVSIHTNSLLDEISIQDAKVNDKVVSAYAILSLMDIKTHNIIMQKVEAMPVDEYSNAVKASKGGNVHANYKTEMGKKIVLRRAVKILSTMFASDKLDKLFALDNENYDLDNGKKQEQPKDNINDILN